MSVRNMVRAMRWLFVYAPLVVSECLAASPSSPSRPEAFLCPARPCPYPAKERQGAPVIGASFLYWQSKEWGLEFASKSEISNTAAAATQVFNQKLYIPDFAWHAGLKVQFGYSLPHDGWDVEAVYTHSKGNLTNLKRNVDSPISPTGLGVVPLWHYPFIDFSSPTSEPLRFQSASAGWKLYFNTVDVEVGRLATLFPTLPIRLHIGAKGSWIEQSYRVDYSNGTSVSGTLVAPPAQTITYQASRARFNSETWGFGPRAGFNSKWCLGAGFSLIADAAASLLCTLDDLSTKFEDDVVAASGGALPCRLREREKFSEVIPVVETKLGFDWGTCICYTSHPVYVDLTIAYEVQYWWSQNHMRRNYPFDAPATMWDMRGDLQMQGLTASLRWDY